MEQLTESDVLKINKKNSIENNLVQNADIVSLIFVSFGCRNCYKHWEELIKILS